jgi:Zn2+/Cd2+-exporting ATPase
MMTHQHKYDAQGRQICCTRQEKIYTKAGAKDLLAAGHDVHDGHGHDEHADDDGHGHAGGGDSVLKMFLPAIVSLILLLLAIAFDQYLHPAWFTGWPRLVWYGAAYLPVGLPVLKEAVEGIGKGEVFSEFLLMCIATIGAFAIGEYPEGVAVMLFYAVGEVFQTLAVKRAKANIKTLPGQRPDEVTVMVNNQPQTVKAEGVNLGDIIQLKPGEKLALDGELLSGSASFSTAALTGESKPDTKTEGETVLAGMINLNTVSLVKVTTAYTDSKLFKILELVQNATAQKAPTELFIRKFAKAYTPVVALSTVGIAMGGLGSDATIETADVVIQDDRPGKIPMAINIGRQTKKIVWQNIILAFVVKAVVLILGAGGLVTMWEAVFADVGVALLAILNAVRIQRMRF